MGPWFIIYWKQIAGVIVLAAILGACVKGGYSLAEDHYKAIIASDKIARDKAMSDAQASVIKAQTEQRAASAKAETDHAQLQAANVLLSRSLDDSVHNLEAAILRSRALSTAMADTAVLAGTGAGTRSDSRVAELVGRVNQRISEASSACLHDSAELTSILGMQPP